MDPIGFAEHSLPKIEYTEKRRSQTYAMYDPEQYQEFKLTFLTHILVDCHAITLDDEIIYNVYGKKSIREKIQEDLIRDRISRDPDQLFTHNALRYKKSFRVIIYLSEKFPWFVAIYYTARLDMLTVEYYKSEKYHEMYERY